MSCTSHTQIPSAMAGYYCFGKIADKLDLYLIRFTIIIQDFQQRCEKYNLLQFDNFISDLSSKLKKRTSRIFHFGKLEPFPHCPCNVSLPHSSVNAKSKLTLVEEGIVLTMELGALC